MPALSPLPRPLRPGLIRLAKAAVALLLLLAIFGSLVLSYEYHRYSHVVDRRLAHSPLFLSQLRSRPALHPTRGGRPTAVLYTAASRRQQRVPAYDALPPQLVQAVVAIEDRRFFEHSGVNYLRTAECAVVDTVTFHMTCGGSTLTQQLARNTFLTAHKTLHRKVAEILIANRLEERFNKQQIFALYATEVNLGQNGPQAVRGFRQAARTYFGRNLNQLDLAQCALLAGMIQRPNFFNPYRHPDRALTRRKVVLIAMADTGAITRAQADAAGAEPLQLASVDPQENDPAIEVAALGW